MKIYVASTLTNAVNASALINMLKAAGHEITYDWTQHGRIPADQQEKIVAVAVAELQGVLDAHVLVVLQPGGFGTHVELGAALAKNKPVVMIGADLEKPFPSFYRMKNISHVKDENECIKFLELFREYVQSSLEAVAD